jgi:fermentation-respiration switch protein FrsA (DUF1100 family)
MALSSTPQACEPHCLLAAALRLLGTLLGGPLSPEAPSGASPVGHFSRVDPGDFSRVPKGAYDHLVERGNRHEQIVAHGESLGCAVAVDLASRRQCGGLVLEAPFTSVQQVAARVLPVIGPILVKGFDSEAKIGRVGAPVLIIHGDQDEVIDYQLGRKLFDAAVEPKSFWSVSAARHNDIVETAGPEYRRRLQEFYEGLALGDGPGA